jgi:hypothetical protein
LRQGAPDGGDEQVGGELVVHGNRAYRIDGRATLAATDAEPPTSGEELSLQRDEISPSEGFFAWMRLPGRRRIRTPREPPRRRELEGRAGKTPLAQNPRICQPAKARTKLRAVAGEYRFRKTRKARTAIFDKQISSHERINHPGGLPCYASFL